MRDVDLLHPLLREKLSRLLSECKKAGLVIGIGETLRTKEEQDDLYAKGRTQPGNVVTKARGSTYSSMHQWGIAFDFYRADGKGAYNDADGFFEKVGKLGEDIGLMWGGRWKSPVDKPHFQLPDWGSTASKLKKQYESPEKFIKTWEETEMTADEKLVVEKLKEKVALLEKEKEKIYHYTAELPCWARPTIQKLMDKGIYAGATESDLNLPETLMRTLVINDRAGLY